MKTYHIPKTPLSQKFKSQSGLTLLEVLLAIAILGITAVALALGLGTSFKANGTANRQTTAMTLAQSQVEYVENQSYQSVSGTAIQVNYLFGGNVPSGYSIWTYSYSSLGSSPDLVPCSSTSGLIGIPWNNSTDQPTTENGLQKISVIVKYGENTLLTIDSYKVNLQ